MSDIVASVRKVADVIVEITAASAEQSAGISHVNQAISTLDQMTQQNAALVEESAAAASSLSDQANQMAQAVAVFKISDSVVSRPVRDITPAASKLAYNRPKALSTSRAAPALGSTRPASLAKKPLALAAARPVSTVKKPLAVAAPKKTAPAAPAASQAAPADDWETF